MSTLSNIKQYEDTVGSGGGKSGGGGGSEAADTLVTNEMVKILNLLSEGEVNLYTGDGRSIFLNNIPLQNSDGSFNFGNYNETVEANNSTLYYGAGSTYWEYRNGAASQTPMDTPAFPSASTIFTVNQEMTGGTISPPVSASPVIYSVTSPLVDYVKVAISLPNGIGNVDGNGNIVGDTVNFAIDTKAHSGSSWVEVLNHTINAKSDNAAIVQYQVNNPVSGSLWDIRVRRITIDNSNATRKNQTYVDTIEEVQQITLPYNGIAYCGLALNAATIGGSNTSIPQMSFLVSKGPIQIPSNYNPNTWTFTGVWDGTFTTGVTDDPAWVLYDLLTNPQYGVVLYGRLTAGMIDKYSFYNASVFNNGLVSNGKGGTEPRFTFNAAIQNRQDIYVTLNQVAATFNSVLCWDSGLLKVLQDRPTSSMYAITKSNVIGSDPVKPSYFNYSATPSTQRVTAVNVTYTDGSDPQFLPTTCSVTDSTGLTRYGYQPYNLAAFGATTEGQALRAGKYYLYQQLYNTEQVEFQTGPEGFNYALYDVFDLFDDDYAGTAVGGRVVAATTNSVTFDQPITITASSKVSIFQQDGTYETHTITNSAGTYTTVNITGTFTEIPTQYATYGVTSAIEPRQFRIVNLKYDSIAKTVDVIAAVYNEANYSYVESGVAVQAGVYTLATQVQPSAPTNVVTTPTQYINAVDNQLVHGVSVAWDRPASQNVSYMIKWRKDNGAYTSTPQFTTNSYTFTPIVQGVYEFLVYSINIAGNFSAPASQTYTLDTSGGGSSSSLADVTGLYVLGTTGTAWTGEDLSITWTNPAANQGLLKDFVVDFKTTTGTLLRSVIVPNVNGGSAQSYVYTWAMNQVDGGPNRSIAVTVYCRDAYNDLTVGTTATMTNAAPPVPLNISASPGLQSCIIAWTPETGTDVAGYIVWYSETSGFTPSSANAIDCGMSALASLPNLTKNTNYYFIVACYDVFGKSLTGSGLNLSSQLEFTTPSNVGTPSGSSLPTTGMTAGDFFFLTTTSTLYKYSGTAWIAVGVQEGASLPTTGMNIGDVFFLTTNGKLYRYTSTGWTTAVDGADIVANSIAANSIVTGSLTTAQFSTGSLNASVLTLGSGTSALFSVGSLTGDRITANSIVAGQLNVATLSAITANVGTLTAGTISNNSGTNTINLSATGSSYFIDTPNFTVTASGVASVSSLSSLSANLGTVTAGVVQNSSGSAKFDLTNGEIVFNNGSYMKVTGTGFGSSNQFIEWYGPTQSSLSTCTETNALFYLTTSGGAYFGGTLLAGTLTNSTQATVLSNTNVADLGPYSSNGGTITITYSFSFTGYTSFPGTSAGLSSYNSVTKQAPNYTIVLSQSIGGGAFTDVATLSGTGTYDDLAPVPADVAPGYYRQNMGGSGTYTDTAHSTATREYKLRITTWNNIDSTVTANTLAIQSVE